MGKKKSRKQFSSAENPFNVKINRTKHSILGQNMKGTRGLPGVSHAAGNAKRKEVFHKKKVQLRKANKYLDKRLLDSKQTYEDPATARLIYERKKKFKKSIFNLNDDESLTHKGMPLLDNLSNKIDASDDEEPLDSHFVKQAHFGGFSGDSAPKSRKEIIDELIVESKKRKQEKKVARETNADLIEKLDQEWKERHATLPLLNNNKNLFIGTKSEKLLVNNNKNQNSADKYDPFDVLLQELKFEKRTTPVTCSKTPEEIAKEENKKQKELQEERNRRMNPIDTKHDVNNQLSADSIYDGLDIQLDTIDDQDNSEQNKTVHEFSSHDSDDDSSEDDNENTFEAILDAGNESSYRVEDESQIPNTFKAFCDIVDTHDNLYVVVGNILASVIKNKTKQNVEKLEIFFNILIEYVMKNKMQPTKALCTLDQILPHLYTLSEISPIITTQKLLSLFDSELEYFQASKAKKIKTNFPRFQCLVLFKVCSTIYSVSDFRHPVVTPGIIFMSDILSGSFAVSVQNIISRLYICENIYDCVSYSKRYVPEVIFFLNRVLELVINKHKIFSPVATDISALQKTEVNLEISDMTNNDATKLSIIFRAINLLYQYAQLYSNLLAFKEIFNNTLRICNLLPENYPHFLKEAILQFINFVEDVKKKYVPLTYENKKPVPLKLFEPAFDSKFTKNKDDIKKKRKLVKNVRQKIKKEERSMLREIRRENQVIASEKLKEKLEGDEERKRKVKQLYSELSMQEGECKKYMKKK